MAVIRIAKDRRREIKMKKNNQPKYQKKSDDEDEDSKSKKKKPKKTYATDLVNVYQIEVVPKSSGKDESHNKLHMCTLCTDTNFTNFAKHLIDMHPEEDEVLFIRQHPKKSKKRSEMISMLKARGNHAINMKPSKLKKECLFPIDESRPEHDGKWRTIHPVQTVMCGYCVEFSGNTRILVPA